jgi:uncharacterized protein (TIGR04255 family)
VSFSHQQGQVRMEFGNPPVAETAIGFYFQKIEGWNVLHLGALWERFRTKYPEYEFLPTVLDNPPQPNTMFDLPSLPVRVGFLDKTKTQLVQMQNGLLLHNWRKTANLSEYQRYENIRSQLREDWSTLKAYLREMSLKNATVTRCQMDYFNHLVRGEEWQDFSDLPKTFAVWRGLQQSAATDKLQMASFSVSYRLDRGTVNIVVQPAIRSSDGKEIIQFTISSSVVPTNSEDQELFACLDECHNNAARAFIDFTTGEARERWKQNK